MAYLQQNPIDLQNQGSSQVLGPNGQQVQNQPQQVGTGSESAFIGAAPSAGQQAPQAPTSSQRKPSSGQFTNLRSYIQANQGAGQRMGQTVTRDMNKQAQQIGASLDKQKQRYESQVQEQQQQLGAAKQQAQSVLQKAMGISAPQPVQQGDQSAPVQPVSPSAEVAKSLTQEEIQSFRDLATGSKQFKDVQDLNLAAEEAKKQNLARQAENLKTFEGRAGQLRELFGKRQAYGSGAATLDSLLLQRGGNLNNLLQQSGGIVDQTKAQVEGTRQQANQQLADLLEANRQASTGLQTEAETSQQGVVSALDTKAEQEKAQRQRIINEFLNPQLQQEQSELDELLNYYSGEATRRRTVDQMRSSLGGMLNQTLANQVAQQNRQSALSNITPQNYRNNPLYNQYKRETGDGGVQDFIRYANQKYQAAPVGDVNQILENYIKTGQGLSNIRIEDDYGYMQPAVKAAFGFTGGQDLATLQNLGFGGQATSGNPYTGRIFDAYQFNLGALEGERARVENLLKQQKTDLQKNLEQEILKSTGVGYPQFAQGADIGRESLATDLDRARYSALAQLSGRQAQALEAQKAENVRLADTSKLASLVQSLRDRFGRKTTGELTNPVTDQSSVGMAGPITNIG